MTRSDPADPSPERLSSHSSREAPHRARLGRLGAAIPRPPNLWGRSACVSPALPSTHGRRGRHSHPPIVRRHRPLQFSRHGRDTCSEAHEVTRLPSIPVWQCHRAPPLPRRQAGSPCRPSRQLPVVRCGLAVPSNLRFWPAVVGQLAVPRGEYNRDRWPAAGGASGSSYLSSGGVTRSTSLHADMAQRNREPTAAVTARALPDHNASHG